MKPLTLDQFTTTCSKGTRMADGSVFYLSRANSKGVLWQNGPIPYTTGITVDLGGRHTEEEQKSYLANLLPQVNEAVERVSGLREEVARQLLENGCKEYAEDWGTAAGERIHEDEEVYLMDEGVLLRLPLDDTDFVNSMMLQYLTIKVDQQGRISMSLQLSFYPDYFMGHVIMGDISPDGTIDIEPSPQG